jgi:hypothetical protein
MVNAFGSKLLRDSALAHIGDWGTVGLKSAFNGIEMGVDFKRKGLIPMFADGEIVRLNTGCCSFPDGDVTGIEIADRKFRLVRWPTDDEKPAMKVLIEDDLRNVLAAVRPR